MQLNAQESIDSADQAEGGIMLFDNDSDITIIANPVNWQFYEDRLRLSK